MPDCAAHHQFGQEVLDRLGAELRAPVLACKREYDTGLQGPDIFFFYRPYRKTEVADYGAERHRQPAARMFLPILAEKREAAALAYLTGLICHYTLDAFCHPYVNGHSRDMGDHHRMEAAYDRHILSRRGAGEARHLLTPASGMDFDAIASLWPGMDAKIIRTCVKSKRFYTWLADHGDILRLLEAAAGRRGEFSSICLPGGVSPEQREHARRLDVLYARALEEAPERIRRACAVMGAPLARLAGFEMNYEGEVAYEQAGEKLDPL